jgi:hypothetical protein
VVAEHSVCDGGFCRAGFGEAKDHEVARKWYTWNIVLVFFVIAFTPDVQYLPRAGIPDAIKRPAKPAAQALDMIKEEESQTVNVAATSWEIF